MQDKYTAFYRKDQAIMVDFSAESISSDGAVVLLEKIERKHKLIKRFSRLIPDYRNPMMRLHDNEKLLKQRVYMLVQGYRDCNDVGRLQNDPLFKDVLNGDLASQPTLSRFENRMNLRAAFSIGYEWIERYAESLKGRDKIIIDIDGTDDPTHGAQQLSLFNGYYGQYMYHELFFHDGDTGQIILPILRPGNSHSNRWYVGILRRIVRRIREVFPEIEIVIRADSGFSCPEFYLLADKFSLKYVIGLASNETLKKRVSRVEKAVRRLYLSKGEKHQHFFGFLYGAKTWHREQQIYCKVESTGLGMNIRYIVSNLEGGDAREIYFGTYVKRGDASENRIKEVKNGCFCDRLSTSGFLSNYLRLTISCLAYELFLLIKQAIAKTRFEKAKSWQVETIRVLLLKVGATIRKTKKRIRYKLSKAFVYRDLFVELIVS